MEQVLGLAKIMIEREEKIIQTNLISIREHDCIWCMVCVSVCPPQAIKWINLMR